MVFFCPCTTTFRIVVLNYTIKHNYLSNLTKLSKGAGASYAAAGQTPIWFVWIIAVLLLLSAGITYRILASRLQTVVNTPIKLPVPLSAFPSQIGNWTGEDIPIPENIQRAAGNDDFLNRLYINKSTEQWANVYIAYSARPRTMSGHRPEICYVGGGWIHDSTEQSEVISPSGRKVPCLIQHFHKPAPINDEIVVLSFHILNGQLICKQSGFSGVGWRTPNIAGNPARYVTQVQISSALENSVLATTKELVDQMIDFFPDKDGKIRATEFINAESSISK